MKCSTSCYPAAICCLLSCCYPAAAILLLSCCYPEVHNLLLHNLLHCWSCHLLLPPAAYCSAAKQQWQCYLLVHLLLSSVPPAATSDCTLCNSWYTYCCYCCIGVANAAYHCRCTPAADTKRSHLHCECHLLLSAATCCYLLPPAACHLLLSTQKVPSLCFAGRRPAVHYKPQVVVHHLWYCCIGVANAAVATKRRSSAPQP